MIANKARGVSMRRKRCAGSIILIVTIAMLVLFGCAALTIDVGMFYMTRSHLQGICDAAALAGASALPTQVAAQDKAAAYYAVNTLHSDVQPVKNGNSYNIGGDIVTVTNPYSDAYTTAKGWNPNDLLKVETTSTVPLTFARALGIESRQMVVSAVALRTGGMGTGWGLGQACLFALDQGFDLDCNTFKVRGSVIANSDIIISLNIIDIGNLLHAKTKCKVSATQVRGHFRLEYGTTYDISCNQADIGAIVKTPDVNIDPPITFSPSNWNNDFEVDRTYAGDLIIDQNNYRHPPGTTRVNGNLNINANGTDLRDCTFIVGGNVNINTNNLYLSYHEQYMCFFLTGTGTVNINQNNVSVLGDIYAPLGYINCLSNNVHRGYWVARRISVDCNNFDLDGIPARASSGSELMLVE